jgi:ribosomal protein S3AE
MTPLTLGAAPWQLARACTLQKAAKRAKKEMDDPFSKNNWDDIKALAMFNIRNIGKTVVTRNQNDI